MARNFGGSGLRDRLASGTAQERGAALSIALMILIVLAFMGSAAIMTSTTEVEVAANQRQFKMAFYEADGGTELGTEILEESLYQRGLSPSQYPNLTVVDPTMYMNPDIDVNCPEDFCKPREGYRDAYFSSLGPAPGTTNLKVGGSTQLSSGGAIQMLAGYEGKGKGAAGGGAWVVYDLRAQHRNVTNSEAVVNLRWRYVM